MKRGVWLLLGILLLTIGAAPAMSADETVGAVMSGNIGYYQEMHKAFVAVLATEGFDHHKVDMLLQTPSPDPHSWTNAARKLAVAEVNVLVTYGAPATLAAIRETKSIPIIFAGVYGSAATGVSAQNVTGISSKMPLTSVLKYLKKLTSFSRIAIVYNELESDSVRQVDELMQLESLYRFQTVKMPVKKSEDIRKLSFAGRADAVFISVSAVANESLESIVKSARTARIPTFSQTGGTAEKGVILSLAPSAAEQGAVAARLTARMLRGEKPAGVHPEVPKLMELALNLREAEAIGIKVPFDLIADATRVIQH